MSKIVLVVAALILTLPVMAQKPTKSNPKASSAAIDVNDPKAKAILDKISKKYDSYASLEASFNLEIELAEQAKEVQKGAVARKGKQYKVDVNSQSMLSDGKALWVILHKNKEVQINDLPDPADDDNLLSPESIFSFYKKGKFIYALVNDYTENGRALQQIEFKPIDKNSEYSKLRLTLDKKTYEVISVKAFSKDGSRYTFAITKLTPNKTFAANYFAFDKAKYPGYHVEDLRE
ncbi:MAG: outer membrane lipoprotein carrier protein LolA [Saprospiraceae bacterium]|nr:outer membrane lipoprotein carrier protein LolA [Saprospiraceae bacterium]